MIPETIPERIQHLRQAMKKSSIDVLILPSTDPHLSEYLPDYWKSREWFSGFTGSAGTLVIGMEKVSLWVDSRYWEQAEQQLENSGIEICHLMGANSRNHIDWILSYFPAGTVVGIDGRLLSLKHGRELRTKLEKYTMTLRIDVDPISEVWTERPELPDGIVFEHSLNYAAFSRQEKIAKIREKLKEKGADWTFISSLDDIAWTLNLRGDDVDYNPIFMSYLLIGPDTVQLFVSKQKIPYTIQQTLKKEGIILLPYEQVQIFLSQLPENISLLLDPQRTSLAMVSSLPENIQLIEAVNPTLLLKSRKAPKELDHIRDVMIDDGAAFCEFQAWFDEVQQRGVVISEVTVAEKIEVCRSRRSDYISPSFGTIAGFNENGALPHYQATKEAFSIIKNNGLLLIDTGGQYLRGTTDMTRVIPVGIPSQSQKRDFTLVLKSVIALSTAHFPRSIPSVMIDAIARKPLWEQGIDFGHGTGHGVGYFLNVHEGPQGISYHGNPTTQTAMEEGMVTSIEPGIYRPGKWGIRIENLSATISAGKTVFGDFLKFETLTQCPIDTRCVDVSMLTEVEKDWLNHYHEGVREKLLPRIAIKARNWLIARTQAI
ncbi:MAG: aminopeptidase P family protein [Oxalobacter sp.]